MTYDSGSNVPANIYLSGISTQDSVTVWNNALWNNKGKPVASSPVATDGKNKVFTTAASAFDLSAYSGNGLSNQNSAPTPANLMVSSNSALVRAGIDISPAFSGFSFSQVSSAAIDAVDSPNIGVLVPWVSVSGAGASSDKY